MKKVLIVSLLILALCLSLVACGGSKPAKTSATTAATEAEEPATENVPAETKRTTTNSSSTTKQTEATEAPVVDNGQNDTETEEYGTPNMQSSASFEDIVRSYYYTCQGLADDGIVRDYFTNSPIEFSYNGEDVVWYSYKSGDEFRNVYIACYGADAETGEMSYQVIWG